MPSYNAPFEIHVHGQVVVRADVTFDQLQEALKPLWAYAGARSLTDGASSSYEEEPGIQFNPKELTIAKKAKSSKVEAKHTDLERYLREAMEKYKAECLVSPDEE